MKILRTVAELRKWRLKQASLGFVPTMGALHQGHLRLLQTSLQQNESTLLSIFVNPSQFSPTEDLHTYPENFESDVLEFAKLVEHSRLSGSENARSARDLAHPENTAVFAPTVNEMYPNGIELDVKKQQGTFVEVLGSSHQLEGAVRPHFFRGVATVVTKLLNAAGATKAYFGQKDVQQTVVVRSLVRDLLINTEIVVCETMREPNGLAMSSRNAYLTPEQREQAAVLYKSLKLGKELASSTKRISSAEICEQVQAKLERSALVKNVEYVSINDYDTFASLEWPCKGSVLSSAIRLQNGLRLLDNILL